MVQCYKIINDAVHYVPCKGDISRSVDAIYKTIDDKVTYFTIHAYERLVTEYRTGILLIVTLYIVLYGWAILRGKTKTSTSDFLQHILFMVFVTAFATKWSIFSTFFYDLFTNVPTEFARSIVVSTSDVNVYDPRTPVNLSSVIIFKGVTAASSLFDIGSIAGYVMGFFVFLAALVVGVLSAGLVILAKIVLGLLLGFAPIFMLMALFKNTRGWFESWVRQLFSYAMYPILVGAIVAMTFSLLIGPLDDFISLKKDIKVYSSIEFIFVGAVITYLLAQIQGIAAQLGGGFAMQTFEGVKLAKDAKAKYGGYGKAMTQQFKNLRLRFTK